MSADGTGARGGCPSAVGRFKLNVVAPCSEDWTKMAGDERERFCTRCSRTVHDLSAMTEAEARTLLAGPAEQMCVRFGVRRDGTVATRGSMRWFERFAGAIGVAVAAAVFWTGVVLLQRPWRAVARMLAASTSPAPLHFQPTADDEERRRAYDEVMQRLAASTRQLMEGYSSRPVVMGTMDTTRETTATLGNVVPERGGLRQQSRSSRYRRTHAK